MARFVTAGKYQRVGLSTVVSGEYCTILTSRLYRADGTVPGFVYCAGYGAGGVNLIGPGPWAELAKRGYPVISGDLGDTPTALGQFDGPGVWGNDAALTKLDTYRTYLQGTLGAKAGKIGLLYASHGCAAAFNWARAHPTDVYCIAGAIGAADVEDVRANNRSGLQASIEAAYTDNATWQAARPTHNPVEHAATVAAVPCRIMYSADDPICLASTQTALAAAVGANATAIAMAGASGHDISPLYAGQPLTDFTDWVEAHLS